ncbi:hypothetical protein CK500_11055 [Halorubrum salipaludis]|uniref:CARDB domain-containing protein n=1 Tax=Halorubrum salipaludis TaxID=2032630 RepID=A0A2A2FCV1_9EURY|nr:hypothetical protein [Halorubrum salipaludis]PAU83321.1 hypothetical protein CK500_11055 [Halorubrum salipaludis]
MSRSASSAGVRTAAVACAVAALLIASLAVVGGAPGATEAANPAVESFSDRSPGGSEAVAQTDDGDVIRLRSELAQTDERGTVGVTTRAEIPDRVTELEVTLLSVADGGAVEADGFEPADDDGSEGSVWEWDGETADPSLTYATEANDTVEGEGPLAVDGTYRFVDAGEWALVRTPRVGAAWSYTGEYEGQVRLDRETVVAGEGVASRSMAFLGPHEEHVREAAGQRYRLIVPDAAEPVATPDEVFGVFADASTALQVGARGAEVVAIAAPTGEVSWAVRGLQTGDADLWVRDEEPAGTAADVWTHEYVHTRQAYRTESSGRWITEASATHYAALFALQRGAADFDEFEATLARGEREPDASSVLADPNTWEGNADYTKGALVAGEIDRRLRAETDGAASLATVLRELNEADGPITNEDILDAVEAAAAEGADDATATEVRADAERLTTTETTAETWDRDAHAAAFGETPAQVGYALADDGVRATGEYRNRTVARDPVELVGGESLALSVVASNTGGAAGSYDLTLSVDGEPVANRSGSLDGGEETVERFEHRFDEPGEHEVRIGSERLTVAVSEPARPSVRGVSVDSSRVDAGESVVATATVGNDATVPAGGEIEFRVGGETIATVPVRLDAGEEATIEQEITVSGAGEVTVSAVGLTDEASTTVAVEGDGPIPVDGAPGFGPAVALLSVVLASGALARRGRRGA